MIRLIINKIKSFKFDRQRKEIDLSPELNFKSKLNFERPIDERIAILEMLLWKYHNENIPNDVFYRLVDNGFMEETTEGTFRWSESSNEIGKYFNDKFKY